MHEKSGAVPVVRNPRRSAFLNGAEEGTRTPDPRITNALLYQLSYFSVYRLCFRRLL